MDRLHAEWIREHVKNGGYGQCLDTCLRMQQTFPELRLVSGHYDCPLWGLREHWWLVAPDDAIVDPTAEQFPSRGVMGEYIPKDPKAQEPTGRCMQCGAYCYNDESACSDACRRKLEDYYNAKF